MPVTAVPSAAVPDIETERKGAIGKRFRFQVLFFLKSRHSYHPHNKSQSDVHGKISYLQYTFEGHGDGDIKNGNNLALALVDINIAGDGGDGEGLDGSAVGLSSDAA